MQRALPIENIGNLTKTDVQILRVISVKLGEREKARIEYMDIARSLNLPRSTVRSSVNRMVQNKILRRDVEGLSFVNAIIFN